MYLFRSKQPGRKLSRGQGDHDDYLRIHTQWLESCKANNLELPRKASNEFKKRLKLCVNGKTKKQKAKLNLSKCGLDDVMVRQRRRHFG